MAYTLYKFVAYQPDWLWPWVSVVMGYDPTDLWRGAYCLQPPLPLHDQLFDWRIESKAQATVHLAVQTFIFGVFSIWRPHTCKLLYWLTIWPKSTGSPNWPSTSTLSMRPNRWWPHTVLPTVLTPCSILQCDQITTLPTMLKFCSSACATSYAHHNGVPLLLCCAQRVVITKQPFLSYSNLSWPRDPRSCWMLWSTLGYRSVTNATTHFFFPNAKSSTLIYIRIISSNL